MIYLLCVYFFFAGVTWVAGTPGQGVLGRLAVGDLLLLPLVLWLVVSQPRSIRVSQLGKAALLMLVAFTIGLLNSEKVQESLVEWLVHVYLVIGFLTLYSLIAARPLEERFRIATLWVRMAGILAVIGVYEFGALVLGLPSMLRLIGKSPATTAAVVGTFRNTGQAGVFFVVALATAVPVLRCLTGRRKTEVAFWIAALAVAMILTVKRSAMVASGAGLLLLFVMERGWRGRLWSTVAVVVALGVAIPAFRWANARSEAFQHRVAYKLGDRGAHTFENFAQSNVATALSAFESHPITGVGLGGVAGVYSDKYEIHSTYLGVPATTGIVGSLAYLWFILVMFRSMTTTRNGDPRTRAYGRTLRALMLGLMLSFGYTYHLRKREFWLTAAIASALMAPEAGTPRRRWSSGRGTPAQRPVLPPPDPEPEPALAAAAG